MIPEITIYDESTDGRFLRILNELGSVVWEVHTGRVIGVEYFADAVSVLESPPPQMPSPEVIQAKLEQALADHEKDWNQGTGA